MNVNDGAGEYGQAAEQYANQQHQQYQYEASLVHTGEAAAAGGGGGLHFSGSTDRCAATSCCESTSYVCSCYAAGTGPTAAVYLALSHCSCPTQQSIDEGCLPFCQLAYAMCCWEPTAVYRVAWAAARLPISCKRYLLVLAGP